MPADHAEGVQPITVARDILRNCELRNPHPDQALQIGILAALLALYDFHLPIAQRTKLTAPLDGDALGSEAT